MPDRGIRLIISQIVFADSDACQEGSCLKNMPIGKDTCMKIPHEDGFAATGFRPQSGFVCFPSAYTVSVPPSTAQYRPQIAVLIVSEGQKKKDW